jgi:hypothetical protein
VLPLAADFRRLILAFHKLFGVLPGEKPERARIPMKPLMSRRGSVFDCGFVANLPPGSIYRSGLLPSEENEQV